MVLGLDDCLYKDWNGRVGRNKANLLAEDQNNTTAKSKGIWVFAIVWMVLTVFSEDLQKASRDIACVADTLNLLYRESAN